MPRNASQCISLHLFSHLSCAISFGVDGARHGNPHFNSIQHIQLISLFGCSIIALQKKTVTQRSNDPAYAKSVVGLQHRTQLSMQNSQGPRYVIRESRNRKLQIFAKTKSIIKYLKQQPLESLHVAVFLAIKSTLPNHNLTVKNGGKLNVEVWE